MRALGLDVGTKTIGVAVSDELGFTAQGLPTVRRTNLKEDLAALEGLVREWGVGTLVVGLPLHMNGDEGERARASRAFGDTLAERVGLPVEYWDERLTTSAAQRVLIEGNVSRKQRKAVVDKLAAGLILQGWLASKSGPADPYDD